MSNITTNELAAQLGTSPRETRKFLRSITPRDEQPGKGSRWSIPGSKREVTKLQKQYGDWHRKQLEAAAERAAKLLAEQAEETGDES